MDSETYNSALCNYIEIKFNNYHILIVCFNLYIYNIVYALFECIPHYKVYELNKNCKSVLLKKNFYKTYLKKSP